MAQLLPQCRDDRCRDAHLIHPLRRNPKAKGGAAVEVRETLHSKAATIWAILQLQAGESAMTITPRLLHAVEAISSSVRIEKEIPRAAEVHLQLAGGEFLSMAMDRNVRG